MAKVALVTGCSSGIGLALCYSLDKQVDSKGKKLWRVFASARKLESLLKLKEDGIETVQLDVTKQESVDAAIAAVLKAAHTIDLVICNAGMTIVGPVLEQPIDEVEKIFNTNYLGVLRTVQAVAKPMVSQRSGTIVVTGSVAANLSFPYGGAYSASKASVHATFDALRVEVAPFGIKVVVVEAGAIKSSISANAAATGALDRYLQPSSIYYPAAESIKQRIYMSQAPAITMPADKAADYIVSRLQRKSPPRKIIVGGQSWLAHWMGLAQKFVAPWLVDILMTRRFGLGQLNLKGT